MVNVTATGNRSNDDDDQPMEEPPSAMLSLLEKYSRMDAQMTQVRQEVSRIQLEIQTRNANTEKLLEERQEMIVKKERISKESKILHEDAKQAHQKLEAIQLEVLQSKHRKQQAQRNVDQLELQSKEYRQRFFESSIAFRKECKKRKITCQKLGLIHEPLVAHAVVFRPQLLSSLGDSSSSSSSSSLQSQKQAKKRNRLVAQLRALETSHAASKRKRDSLQEQKENLLNRSRDRNRRKSNLQVQLDRILKDIDTLHSRIRQSQKEKASVPDRRETTPSYQQGIPNNNNHANCPSRSTANRNNPSVGGSKAAMFRNPYAKKTNQTNPQQPLSSSRRERKNSQKPNVKTSGGATATTTSTTEQYPHRIMGRRRRAPQDFGLSLRIQDDDTDNSSSSDDDSKDDDLLSFVAFRK